MSRSASRRPRAEWRSAPPSRLTGAPPREPEHAFTRICSDSRLLGLVREAGERLLEEVRRKG